jgi:regulator of sigma E protease
LLHYLLAFLVVIGVLVVVHEYGHYQVARWCGVKILRFSVGFGPVLWERKLGQDQTEWAVALLPLGGFVRMLDEREAPVAPDELHRAFNRQSVFKRSLVVAAGPVANLLLAVFLYWGLFWQGGEELRPVLAAPPASSVAAQAGIRDGDLVLSLDQDTSASWSDFRWLLLQKSAETDLVQLKVLQADGQHVTRTLSLASVQAQGWEGDALEQLGVRLYRPKLAARIGSVLADSPASRAGLQTDDVVEAVDGLPVADWIQLVQTIQCSASKPLRLTIRRYQQSLTLSVTPEAGRQGGREVGKIGIGVAASEIDKLNALKAFVSYDPLVAASKAVREVWDKTEFSFVMLGKMLLGEVSWRNLSGPVSIADYAGQSAQLGLSYYLKFMALVSVSLGVLNLLPIPVLDGGHLLYYTIEAIRGRPLPEHVLLWLQKAGLALLLSLMTFAFINDLSRLFSG